MSHKPTYCKKSKSGFFEYQRRIPKLLQPIIGKKFWSAYLRTDSHALATMKARAIAVEHDALIEYCKKLSPTELSKIQAAKGFEALERKVGVLKHGLLFLEAASASLAKPHLSDEDGNLFPDSMVVEQVADSQEALLHRDQLKKELEETERLLPNKKPSPKNTINGFFTRWKKVSDPSEQAIKTMQVVLQRFTECEGDLELRGISRKCIRSFADKCAEIPNRRSIPVSERDKPMPELISIGKAKKLPKIKTSSANKTLDQLKTYLNVALREDLIDFNPGSGISIKDKRTSFAEKKDDERLPMSSKQIKTLFRKIKNPTDLMIAKLMAYQGLRNEEAAQLCKSDFQIQDGILCIEIHDRGANHLKNSASVRVIPVHQKIKKDVETHLARLKGESLFKLRRQDGRLSRNFGARMSRLIRNHITDDRRIVLYSLRHNFIDACRAVEMPDGIRYRFCGHTSPDANAVAEGYGTGYPVGMQSKWLNKVDPLKN